jgi:hypothetical protein
MKYLIATVFVVCAPAFAQQAPQLPSPGEQALSDQMLDTLRSCISVRAALIDAQRKLADAETKIKSLEAKPEAK